MRGYPAVRLPGPEYASVLLRAESNKESELNSTTLVKLVTIKGKWNENRMRLL